MKKKNKKKKLKTLDANNYYCFFCALHEGEIVEADRMIWDKERRKALPICELHYQMSEIDPVLTTVCLN